VKLQEVGPVSNRTLEFLQFPALFAPFVGQFPKKCAKTRRFYYRLPAYLLSTDLTGSARTLLQIDSDRLQIEDEVSVPKQPVLAVAAYKLTLSYENLTSAAAA
jgi:hypothetical protein